MVVCSVRDFMYDCVYMCVSVAKPQPVFMNCPQGKLILIDNFDLKCIDGASSSLSLWLVPYTQYYCRKTMQFINYISTALQ